jgi:hypothetical protein
MDKLIQQLSALYRTPVGFRLVSVLIWVQGCGSGVLRPKHSPKGAIPPTTSAPVAPKWEWGHMRSNNGLGTEASLDAGKELAVDAGLVGRGTVALLVRVGKYLPGYQDPGTCTGENPDCGAAGDAIALKVLGPAEYAGRQLNFVIRGENIGSIWRSHGRIFSIVMRVSSLGRRQDLVLHAPDDVISYKEMRDGG